MLRPLRNSFRAVFKIVFNGVGVEILVDVVATIMSTTAGLGADRKGVFHPTSFVNIVDEEVAKTTATGPQETMKTANLVFQFRHFIWFRRRKCRTNRTRHAVRLHGNDVANLTVLNTVKKLAPSITVATHEPHTHFEILGVSGIGKLEHSA